jgi:desulfoferrodoxin (superoxide reductase-like protein)
MKNRNISLEIDLKKNKCVAIGRYTSVDGLRIINFKDEVCLPHPETVELFCSWTCLAPDPDLKQSSFITSLQFQTLHKPACQSVCKTSYSCKQLMCKVENNF